MANIIIRPVTPEDKAWIKQLVAERWGADIVVGHGVVYYPHELPGFVAEQNGTKVGLITYHIAGNSCEIVTIDSLRPGNGIGTALIDAVKTTARQSGCTRLWLITTNDNLNALRFYQKRGFVLVAVHRNAVERSRLLKPTIPLIGQYGISIRDEIELELTKIEIL
jgi:ribosomal protein S18 acetylase RimI-like enzyme